MYVGLYVLYTKKCCISSSSLISESPLSEADCGCLPLVLVLLLEGRLVSSLHGMVDGFAQTPPLHHTHQT